MALPYKHSGTFLRSRGIFTALATQSKLLNLKPAKKIEFSFDPFGESVRPIRNALSYFSQDRVQETNPKCLVKANVLCTRAEPSINITLETGKKLLFKTKNLETLDILELYNKHISSQVQKEEVTPAAIKQTKAQKKR